METRPRNHHYSLSIIQLALLIKLLTSSGFRAIQKILSVYILHFNLKISEPSHVTILVWTKKLGCNQIMKKVPKAVDWVIILDESVEFGHDRLLVIYGVRSGKTDFGRALRYSDLTPFAIISNGKWTGELIHEEIEKVRTQCGKILYAVADGGNAVKKALHLSGIPHVYDITHKLAWFLKGTYKGDADFEAYTKKMAKMRGTLSLTDVSHILPPNQRVHSRFMNIGVLSDWGERVLNYLALKKKGEREYRELEWVGGYSKLIGELSDVSRALNKVMLAIKTNGLSKSSIKEAKKALSEMKTANGRTAKLKADIMSYLEETKLILPKNSKIICTSDIIESSFGKYKNYINNNPMTGITNLSLCLAAFTSKLETDEIKSAMENVRNKEVKMWSEANIGKTNFSRRKEILRKTG